MFNTTYFRPFKASGITNIYSDVGIVYQIDWVLVQLCDPEASCFYMER